MIGIFIEFFLFSMAELCQIKAVKSKMLKTPHTLRLTLYAYESDRPDKRDMSNVETRPPLIPPLILRPPLILLNNSPKKEEPTLH